MSRDIIGKTLYNKEKKLGEISNVMDSPFNGNEELAVVKTGMNNYKAAPLQFLQPVGDRYTIQRHRSGLDGFPEMSLNDLEDEDKLRKNLTTHYGQPQSWSEQGNINQETDQEYMGSSQITDQAPSDNESLKDEVDFNKLKRDSGNQ